MRTAAVLIEDIKTSMYKYVLLLTTPKKRQVLIVAIDENESTNKRDLKQSDSGSLQHHEGVIGGARLAVA